jgi:hypothetical protein
MLGMLRGGRKARALWHSLGVGAAAAVVLVTPTGAVADSHSATNTMAASLPARFSGSLTILVRQSPWSEVDPAVPVKRPTRFSGYSATFKFTRVTFAPGKYGPYTLTGTLAPTRFYETEDSPNPQNTEPCIARYTFTSTGKPFGDLGGFSLRNGRWVGELALGVQTTGAVQADNCGPNFEYTANQFGRPPRIDVSIGGEADYNPVKRVLAISTTYDVPIPADEGTQTDTDSGELFP